jgi:hypothetical protein
MHCVKQILINAKLQICLRGKKTELIGRIPVRRLKFRIRLKKKRKKKKKKRRSRRRTIH